MMDRQKSNDNMIKPLSRFVEHFDMMMPPSELLDTIGEEDEKQQQLSQLKQVQPLSPQQEEKKKKQQGNNNIESKKQPSPLYALPGFGRQQKSDNSNRLYNTSAVETKSPTSPLYSPSSNDLYVSTLPATSNGRGIRNYLGDRGNNGPTSARVRGEGSDGYTVRNLSKSKSSSLLPPFNGNIDDTTNIKGDINDYMSRTQSVIIDDKRASASTRVSNASSITSSMSNSNNNKTNTPQQQPIEDSTTLTSSKSTTLSSGSTKRLIGGRGKSLNRADIIMKRYDSWSKFIILLSLWLAELLKLSSQSEKSYHSLLRSYSKISFLSNKSNNNNDTTQGLFITLHGFTKDLAQQELNFGKSLQKQHLPLLAKLKKECLTAMKSLKLRGDLNLEEYLKRAEVTASLIAQLSKCCKEARRCTIEKGGGGQMMTNSDPWLVNLYVLRQLKREVDEENRLRKLMIPIQESTIEFETRLLKAVEAVLQLCFDKLSASLTETQLGTIHSSLNQAVANNWDTFAAKNKDEIVNPRAPLKHYLNINYACKNDPLVMTLHKGRMERRTGVLNKHSTKFFVLTESGFLHQFKLNDKVSPEFSIYLPKSAIVPGMDVSSIDLSENGQQILHQQQEQQQQKRKAQRQKDGGYTFEIQRSGSSVLQRDKSYVFRVSSLEELVIWCKLLTEVATRPPESIPKRSLTSSDPPPTQVQQVSTNTTTPTSIKINSLSLSESIKEQQQPQQEEEHTPPPSPIGENRESLLSIAGENNGKSSEPLLAEANNVDATAINSLDIEKPKHYSAQLNI